MVSIHWSNGNWVVYNPSAKNWTILGSDKKTIKGHYSISSGTGKYLYNLYIKKKSNNNRSNNSSSSSNNSSSSSSSSSSSTDTSSTDTSTSTYTTTSTDTSATTEDDSTKTTLKGYKLNRLPKKKRDAIIKQLKEDAKGNIVETTITDLDTLIQKEQPSYLEERAKKREEEKAKLKAQKEASINSAKNSSETSSKTTKKTKNTSKKSNSNKTNRKTTRKGKTKLNNIQRSGTLVRSSIRANHNTASMQSAGTTSRQYRINH